MIAALTLILSCQLAGEILVGLIGLPIPGPVLGMLILFLFLLWRGRVPDGLDRTATGLLRGMSLLFVPAGAGVMLHFQLLGEALLPLSVALVVSTLATIAVTALMMGWLGKNDGGEDG